MKKIIMSNISKAMLKAEKHSPEILAVTGVIGVVATVVMACRATTKVNDILDEAKAEVEAVHKVADNNDKYTENEKNQALAVTYAKTGLKLAKEYAPAVALGVFSVGCMLTSNHILKSRNIALGAAYAALDAGFKKYRGNVVERFGETVDRELKYSLKPEKVTEVVVDEETGKEKKVKTIKNYINPDEMSDYARFFEYQTRDENGKVVPNMHWNSSNEYNIAFLKNTQKYANDMLKARGHLFLNEVYDMLGLPRSKAGQVVGWVYNLENPVGDNYVDFGIFSDPDSYSDYIYGNDPAILLDFNVDGVIWELI